MYGPNRMNRGQYFTSRTMSSSSNLRTLTAILALASVTAQLTGVAAQDTYLRKKGTRKLHRAVHHVEKAEYKKGLEEDVVFWTNLVRKTQGMSLPPDPVPTPTNPPVPVGTDPPVGSVTSPPIGTPPPVVVDPTDPPVAGPGGDFPTYPPVATPAPVGSVTSPPVGTPPPVVVDPTDPPVGVGTPPPVVVDPTEPPVAGPGGDFPTYPPVATPAPVGSVTSPPVAGPGGDFPTYPPVATPPPVGVDPTDPPIAGPATTPPVAVGPTDPPVSAFKCPDVSSKLDEFIQVHNN